MGPLSRYNVTQPDGTVATLKLTEEQAKAAGATPVEQPAERKARTTSNKARTAEGDKS